jgi:FtsP/CotA-like multicopper oxidase with cupredoxin domain
MRQLLAMVITMVIFAQYVIGQVVHYDLHVTDTLIAFDGKPTHAIAVNGQLPMPTLVFTEGDTAEITVHNHLKVNTSLHWHGVFLPNREDGVPYLTQQPIAPNTTYTYRFPVIQNGTHWYHSHSGFQEQIGMYGMLIFKKKESDISFRTGIDDLPEHALILSEWTSMDPHYVHHLLRSGSDWFTIKKNAAQSYSEAIKAHALDVKIGNEWKRMTAMDVSDVHYDHSLVNGKLNDHVAKEDTLIKLRIANGSASSYFWLSYAGGKIMVTANDGNDVVPVEVDRMMIAVSETYDVVLRIPAGKTYEFLVMSEDRTLTSSIWLGSGDTVFAFRWPKLNYFRGMAMMNSMMRMNGSMDPMGMQMSMQEMDMNETMYPELLRTPMNEHDEGDHAGHDMRTMLTIETLNYGMLQAPSNTRINNYDTIRTLHFTLTGNMQRYVWTINGKVVSEVDKILIHKNELVRIVLTNNSMMRHPMHLHGHDFRILNGHGDNAPLKNVLDIMPMETDTIEFLANVEGDWYFHCHLLYHMMSGMGRVFSVDDDAAGIDSSFAYNARKFYKDDRALHVMVNGSVATNGSEGMMMLQNTRWQLSADWMTEFKEHPSVESEVHLGRYFGNMQWFFPYIGLHYQSTHDLHAAASENLFGQEINVQDQVLPGIGFTYLVPLNFTLQTDVFMDGTARIQLMRDDIPLTPRLRMMLLANTDKEYEVGLSYVLLPYMGISATYGNIMGGGVGLYFSY